MTLSKYEIMLSIFQMPKIIIKKHRNDLRVFKLKKSRSACDASAKFVLREAVRFLSMDKPDKYGRALGNLVN